MDSANEPANKEVLRDPEHLGRLWVRVRSQFYADAIFSRRLGATLYGSKGRCPWRSALYRVPISSHADYVVLENLLLLVLIVAPGFEPMGKRGAFVREVFLTGYPEDNICGENLANILTKPTERDSDILQAQAIDILAKSNLML